ncbi:MAG TPA: hypothetical protein VJV03_17985 [Pyrinomonadaceae bacterium]|nr:hypothetical protein [Pyrinomonadaceae bacterium]
MSLAIIIASTNGIVVAAERRVGSYIHPTIVDAEKYRLCPSALVYFDGCKKLTVYEPPHSFVAFTYTGSGSINSHQLIEDLKQKVPSQRLLIREYADALLKLYSENPDQYRLGYEPFAADTSNNIYVTGYDQGAVEAFLFQLDLPFRAGPTLMSMHPGGIVVSGTGDHLEAAIEVLRERQIRKLEKQISGNRLVGSPTAIHEAKLHFLRNSDIQWAGMSIQEMQESAELIIEHTVAEQIRLNEVPSVGGGIDVIRMTRRRGVEVIKYDPYLEVGKRPLAETHHNFIVLNCCGQNVEMQIDFELDNPLVEPRLRYPADEQFQCPICRTSHDLSELRKVIQETVNYYIIVDGKRPEILKV